MMRSDKRIGMFLSAMLLPWTASSQATQEEVAALRAQLFALIPAGEPARTNVVGSWVRLAFHDAATFDRANPIAGRANGCVDLSNVANAGLNRVIDAIEPTCAAAATVSRADCWQLTANVAIEAAGGPSIPFRVGRVDVAVCAGAASLAANHPDAERTDEHTTDVFVTRMGFTQQEVRLGPHTTHHHRFSFCHATPFQDTG